MSAKKQDKKPDKKPPQAETPASPTPPAVDAHPKITLPLDAVIERLYLIASGKQIITRQDYAFVREVHNRGLGEAIAAAVDEIASAREAGEPIKLCTCHNARRCYIASMLCLRAMTLPAFARLHAESLGILRRDDARLDTLARGVATSLNIGLSSAQGIGTVLEQLEEIKTVVRRVEDRLVRGDNNFLLPGEEAAIPMPTADGVARHYFPDSQG